MAGAQCLNVSLLPATPTVSRLKVPTAEIICFAVHYPSRATKRRSRLRPKILKTLTKPSPAPQPPSQTSANPETPAEFTETAPSNAIDSESPSVQIDAVEGFHVSGGSGAPDEYGVIAGKLSTNALLKYGMYVLGYFVFQTICAVWVMGSAYSEKKDESSNDDLGFDQSNKENHLLYGNGKYYNGYKSSNVIDLDELKLKEKIEEIRAMAREARRVEQKEDKDAYDEEEDVLDRSSNLEPKLGIEKEIGSRLVNLEKRLNSNRKGLLLEHKNGLDKSQGESEEKKNNMGSKKDDVTLMFKKKYKFRSPSMIYLPTAKGFSRLENRKVSKNSSNGLNGAGAMGRKENLDKDADFKEGDLEALELGNSEQDQCENLKSLEKDGKQSKNMQKESGTAAANIKSGHAQGTDGGRASNQGTKPKTSRASRRVNQDKRLDTVTDMWWQNLSYVLTIVMRRGLDDGYQEGLFTLRTNSQGKVSDVSSYTVAFEDHGDANNFCYLLEAFFQDLGDFGADIVPMSTKDFQKVMESDGKKAIVIRKRQLKLYAGQPFEDVERALYSLIEENEENKV